MVRDTVKDLKLRLQAVDRDLVGAHALCAGGGITQVTRL